MSCWDTVADYGLRAIGIGLRGLPKTDFTLCQQVTLIGSGMIWNVYFGAISLFFGFSLPFLWRWVNFQTVGGSGFLRIGLCLSSGAHRCLSSCSLPIFFFSASRNTMGFSTRSLPLGWGR